MSSLPSLTFPVPFKYDTNQGRKLQNTKSNHKLIHSQLETCDLFISREYDGNARIGKVNQINCKMQPDRKKPL